MFRLSRSVEIESDFDKSGLVLEIPACLCPGVSGCFGLSTYVETPHRYLPSINTLRDGRTRDSDVGRAGRAPPNVYVMPTVLRHTSVLDIWRN